MNTFTKIIEKRRRKEEIHDDFVQSLLCERGDEDGAMLTDKQICDNILTLIIAGQDTTAIAMAWMVKYLDDNQNIQQTLRVEAHTIRASTLSLEDLNKMAYACKVVKEALQMATIVPWFPREALVDCLIGGFQIRKGWIVNIDARAIHHDPSIYKEPMEFNLLRFQVSYPPPRLFLNSPLCLSLLLRLLLIFLVFGAGLRTWLGMNLAKAMMLVFLHRLVTTYRWEVIDSDSSLVRWSHFPKLKSERPIRVTTLK
ncbi:hypothetical protein AMTRI_Chr03g49610 [Amborella trichopoda]